MRPGAESVRWICLEGLGGVGKTTVAAHATAIGGRMGMNVLHVPEFSSGPTGVLLREKLTVDPFLRERDTKTAFTLMHLVAADYAFRYEHQISSAGRQGVDVVIMERGRPSVVACQGSLLSIEYGMSVEEAVDTATAVVSGLPAPFDGTVFLDVDDEERWSRLRARDTVVGEDAGVVYGVRRRIFEMLMDRPLDGEPMRSWSTRDEPEVVAQKLLSLVS
jgi:thymidylate kinase